MSALDRIDKSVLGDRLRVARTTAGLTQENAAKHLGVARTTLIAIEAGQRAIRAEELVQLTKLYGTSVNTLLRQEAVHVDMSAQFRRIEPTRGWDRGEVDAQRTLQRLAASSFELERALGAPFPSRLPFQHVIGRSQVDEQAGDVAQELRNRLGLGMAPIPDIVNLIEDELGVRVFVRGLDSRIGGLFASPEGIGPCVLLNAKHPRTRRALTAAHELGHALTRPDTPEILLLDEPEDALHERFASTFAMCLLMPAAAIRRRFNDHQDDGGFSVRHLIVMASSFHVSLEAMGRRLEQLGLLPRGRFDALRERGLSEKTVREVLGQQAEEAPPPVPPRFALLAVAAYDRGILSEGQLAEMLMLDRLKVRQLIDATGGEDAALV